MGHSFNKENSDKTCLGAFAGRNNQLYNEAFEAYQKNVFPVRVYKKQWVFSERCLNREEKSTKLNCRLFNEATNYLTHQYFGNKVMV